MAEVRRRRQVSTNGDRHAAIDKLWDYAWILDQSPVHIRASVADPGFAQDADVWLTAVGYSGEALLTTLNGLASRVNGDESNAQQRFAESADLVRQAEAIRVSPGRMNTTGPVKIGDGVLDEFLRTAPGLH